MAQLDSVQRMGAHALFYDAQNQPAAVVGDVVWESGDPNVLAVAALTSSPRNLDVDLVAQGVGEVDVTARAWSSDPQAGRLAATAHVVVVAAGAVRGELVFDAPRPK